MSQEQKVGPLVWEDNQAAPIVLVDIIGAATVIDGTFQITLGAQKLIRTPEGDIALRAKPTAHLRVSPRSGRELVDALRAAFLTAQSAVDELKPNIIFHKPTGVMVG